MIVTGGVALSYPFFAVYLNRDRGLPMGVVGACLGLSMLVSSVSQGLGGELSDVMGRRSVLVASLWARAAAASGLAAGVWLRWPSPVLILFHLLSSFCANFYDPAARGWIADHFGAAERHRAFGVLRVAINAGWAAGPALGGWLAQNSYAALFALTAAVCVACAPLLAAFVRDAGNAPPARRFELMAAFGAAKDARFFRFCAYDVLIAMVMAQLVAPLSVHSIRFVGLSERQVGLLFSLNGLMVVLLQYPMTLWWGRWKLAASLVAGCLFYAAGYAGVGFARGMGGMAAAVAVVTLGEMVLSPGLQTAAANMAPVDLRGRYLGFWGLAHQLGAALGPLSGGLGLDFISPVWAPGHWMGVACAACLASVGFYSMRRLLDSDEEDSAAVQRVAQLEAS